MELYEYLIGGKKTGRIDDLKDAIPDSKPFRDLKEGETFFVSHFGLDGTRTYTEEIKISSIHKGSDGWIFRGKYEGYAHPVLTKDLDKKLEAWDQRTRYMVFSTFKIDDKPFFELIKKEIKN